ncbi:ABC transporter ATP-binding protein [Legionella jamestowniensis]|uniref:ABC transporter ATP-binding protein n=1 Tax=Legionella jamestowniensis TaxID=455 RepID=A0A0W0UIB8_9GAMM|nr:ABC transporter ATP-binding protein [Legionella jamestowniensis]KTD07649.1 ABC transporter ATP binding protein [Legionella jamestowniensis]OCH99392.1 ABC transporter ATP-binding protein [Legionella jamestowniensis]SFL60077.1 lipoprotein-releasing system ATP-binding protein [Legionella jamestowniensis DSM 19215]
MSVLMRAEQLTKRLTGEVPVTLVCDITLAIQAGEFVVVTGPSGSGKSSLLYLLGLLDRPTEGKLWLLGENTATYSEDKLADMRLAQLGYVFQFHFLLPEFSALENVMLPMQRLGKLSKEAIKERAGNLLVSLGLAEQLHKLPKQLSGGQSQRVAIARALANEPPLILADEPTGNLDTASSMNVQTILRELAHQHQRAVVVVTHEPAFAAMADRVIHIVDGKIQS